MRGTANNPFLIQSKPIDLARADDCAAFFAALYVGRAAAQSDFPTFFSIPHSFPTSHTLGGLYDPGNPKSKTRFDDGLKEFLNAHCEDSVTENEITVITNIWVSALFGIAYLTLDSDKRLRFAPQKTSGKYARFQIEYLLINITGDDLRELHLNSFNKRFLTDEDDGGKAIWIGPARFVQLGCGSCGNAGYVLSTRKVCDKPLFALRAEKRMSVGKTICAIDMGDECDCNNTPRETDVGTPTPALAESTPLQAPFVLLTRPQHERSMVLGSPTLVSRDSSPTPTAPRTVTRTATRTYSTTKVKTAENSKPTRKSSAAAPAAPAPKRTRQR